MSDKMYREGIEKTALELKKSPKRTEVINFLLSSMGRETVYLEIGVKDPNYNFNHITSREKYSVDPGVEYKANPVDFQMTSDAFFEKLANHEILRPGILFDVIFVDGLHLADQVDRDIFNSLKYIKNDGFIIMHDCNPPTEWHARENYNFRHTPAQSHWNGTTWKAFMKWRQDPTVSSCCIDSDWGLGVLTKSRSLGPAAITSNPFFEYAQFAANRQESLNLLSFDEFKARLA